MWTGLALSAGGLRLFGVDPDALGDPAFAVGMWPRSGLLGDPVGSDGDRRGWVVGGTEESTPHVLVILGGPTGEALDERLAALAADPDGAIGFTQRGEVLDGEREHFGFRDGLSAVGVRGRLSEAARHFLVRRWIDPADDRCPHPGAAPASRWCGRGSSSSGIPGRTGPTSSAPAAARRARLGGRRLVAGLPAAAAGRGRCSGRSPRRSRPGSAPSRASRPGPRTASRPRWSAAGPTAAP